MNRIKLNVTVSVEVNNGHGATITKNFYVSGSTVPNAFAQIPLEAAMLGMALMNDGTPVTYTVKVMDDG